MHYTEHLVWQNTFQDTQRKIDKHSNALTNHYTVGYWLSGSKEELPELLATLSLVFDSIEVPRDYADEDRDIVLREYDARITGNIDAQADIKIDQFLYAGNSIAALGGRGEAGDLCVGDDAWDFCSAGRAAVRCQREPYFQVAEGPAFSRRHPQSSYQSSLP